MPGDPYHPPLARKLLSLAAPVPGETVLDVACGTGLVALMAAQAVGPGGRVVGVDLSQGMLQQAGTKTAALGLTNTEWIQANIEETSLPAASFDVVACSCAMPFLHDIPTTLRTWRGWLKPGGRLVFNAWEGPIFTAYGIFVQTAAEFGLHHDDPCACIGSKQLVTEALQAAGFNRIKVEVEHKERTFPADSPAAYADKTFTMCCSLPWLPPTNEAAMPGKFEQFKSVCMSRILHDAIQRFTAGQGVSSPYTVMHVLGGT
eukprot:jgi/Chrzof1/14514/Cz09g05190.t1